MKKEKPLSKSEFAKEINKMVYGDSFTLHFIDNEKDFEIYTVLTRTKWSDSSTYMLGGCDDVVEAFPDTEWSELERVMISGDKIADHVYNAFKFSESTKVIISNKANFTIHIKGEDLLGHIQYNKKYDNTIYER